MSIISKNLYFALTVICLIALVWFVVELIVVNSGVEPKEPEAVISGEAGDADIGEDPTADPNNPFEGYVPPTAAPRPPPDGTPRSLMVSQDVTLVIYADDDKFDYVVNDLDWRFEYKGGGNAGLEIGFARVSQQSSGPDAERFLNARTGGNSAEYKGTQTIIDSQLNAYAATAQVEGVTYEAWFYRLRDSELSLYFLIFYEFNGQRDNLYTVLSSMSIEQG